MNKRTDNFFYYDGSLKYPQNAPYMPECDYPEYPYHENYKKVNKKQTENKVYEAIRNIFVDLRLDENNIGSASWNPLGKYIQPGNTVLLKPNLVKHMNPAEPELTKGMECLVTHPSVVRCIFDYVFIALQGRGTIIVADAPVQSCDFEVLLKNTGYDSLFQYLQTKENALLRIKIADLREVVYKIDEGHSAQKERKNIDFGSIVVDLKEKSMFATLEKKTKFRVTSYAASDTMSHHQKGHNEYKISEAALMADVIINLPKPKSHRIAGYTAGLKNLIGVNARKEYLPHHQKGAKGRKGDEYQNTHAIIKWINSTGNDIRNWAVKKNLATLDRCANNLCRYTGRKLDSFEPHRKKFGMWYGNDTIWRTILDVNHIVLYADKKGNLKDEPQRIILNIADMIVCGDHEGPLIPNYKYVGGILFAENIVTFDRFIVKIMGYDWKKIPVLFQAVNDELLTKRIARDVSDKKVDTDEKCLINTKMQSNDERYNKNIDEIKSDDLFYFEPTLGWRNYIEI